MGYESRIYIVQKTNILHVLDNGTKKVWAEVIAQVNMCKCVDFSSIFSKETDCYIYADDGNTQILEDKYGDALKESSIETVIDYLEHKIESGDEYRRFPMLLSMLKPFTNRNEWGDGNIVVLHYGY